MLETLLLYNALVVIAIAMAFVISRSKDGIGEQLLRWGLFLVLWLPAALRHGIGTDWASYVMLYHSPYGQIQNLEPAYSWLNLGLFALGARVELMLAIVAAVTYLPITHGIPKKWLVPVVTIYMLTLYLGTYSLVRQSVAVSILLMVAVQMQEEDNIGKAFVWIAIACLWHASAIIALPLLLIRKIKISGWIALLLIPVLWYVAQHGFIQALFASDLFLSTKYGTYASNSFNRATQIGSGLGIILRLIIPLLYLSQVSNQERKNDLVLYSVMGYVFAYMLAIQVHIFNRLVDILNYAPVVAFGSMYTTCRNKLWLWILVALMAVNFQKTILDNTSDKHGGLGIAPYECIINHL